MSDLSKYSRVFFDSLNESDRLVNLKSLQDLLIQKFKSSADFNKTLDNVVNELKVLGHPFYSLDYDSDVNRFKEVWGSRYHDRQPNGIEIEFESPANITVIWVDTLEDTQNFS